MKNSTANNHFFLGLGVIIISVFLISLVVVFGFKPMARREFLSSGGMGMVYSETDAYSKPTMLNSYSLANPEEYARLQKADFSLISPIPSPSAGDNAATATPRIIKTGNLSLEVDSARNKADEISVIAKNQGGFIETANVSEDTIGRISAYLTLRVPEDKFENTMSELKKLAHRIATDSTNGQDVTEQYTDLEARLRNAEAEEERYLAILKQAQNVEDILAVEQYLSQTRYEIESLTGQIKYLSNQTSYSTISVELFESQKIEIPAAKFDLLSDIKQALNAVILLLQASITFAIWFIIIGSAFLIPLSLAAYVMYRLIKRIFKI